MMRFSEIKLLIAVGEHLLAVFIKCFRSVVHCILYE